MKNGRHTLLALLAFAILIGRLSPVGAQRRISSAESSTHRVGYASWGFSFQPPAGWKHVSGTWVGEFGEWTLTDRKRGQDACLMTLQAVPTSNLSLRQKAEELAKPIHGKIISFNETLDGKPALLIQGDGKWGYDQAMMLVCIRDKEFYELYLNFASWADYESAFNLFKKSWKWEPYASPLSQPSLREAKTSLFDGAVRLQLPEVMGVIPDDKSSVEQMGVYDYRTHTVALVASADLLLDQNSQNFSALRTRYGDDAKKRFHLKQSLAWTPIVGAPKFYLSEVVNVPSQKSETTLEKSIARYGLLQMSDNRVLSMVFAITGQDAVAQKSYLALIEKICQSVKEGGK